MRSLTFTLDTQTGDDAMAPATVTITEQADGTLLFSVTNTGDGDGMIGDIRSLFFDLADDGLLGTLAVNGADVTEFSQSGSVSDMGNGATSSGVPESPYEIGIEIGTQGAAGDDIQSTSFTLSSSLRGLTLDDIALESFFVRQTSVGEEGGAREDSDKLWGDAPYPVNAIDDATIVIEDTVQSGNVFANDIDLDAGDANSDGIPDGLTVTAIDGNSGSVGQAVTVGAAGSGVSAVINADGSYTVDANVADWLAEGESFSDTIFYSVDDGNGGSDTALLAITVLGVNDEEAITGGDTAGAVTELADNDPEENLAVLGDSGTLDFIDVDLSDTHVVSFAPQSGSYLGAFTAELDTDTTGNGTGGVIRWDFSVSDAALDGLGAGEQLIQYYDVSVDDGYGNVATETVTVTITGAADGQTPHDWEDEDHFGTFLNKKGVAQAISNVVLYLQDGEDITKVKIDNWDGSVKDLDDVDLGNFLDAYFGDSDLVAVSIKAGNNHNADLGPGEGQLFLLDGDEDIDYTAGGLVPDPLSAEILAAKADYTFVYDLSLFG